MFRKIRRELRQVNHTVSGIAFLLIAVNIKKIIAFLFSLLIIGIITGLVYVILKHSYFYIKYKDKEFTSEEIKHRIENLSPGEFEIFCRNLFRELGYKSTATKATIAGGKDVILKSRKGDTIYVEVKHYRSDNYVNREVLQKLVGACIEDNIR